VTTTTAATSPAANAGRRSRGIAKELPHDDEPVLLFSLDDGGSDGDENDLVAATLVSRPSKRNKSPYVADVHVPSLEREAICHVPNLDMGGKCRPGVQLLMRRARDGKGRRVGPDAKSPKFGTPKCEFILQLLYVDESAFGCDTIKGSNSKALSMYPPVWVGAHPSLGERIAKVWIERNLLPQLAAASSPVSQVQSQVSVPEAPNRRFDFMITHKDGTRRIVEVKTVVDCDYSAAAPPPADLIKCRYVSSADDYERTAIFPWGTRKQKGGTDGKTPVVSSRAIHHVSELSRLVREHKYQATLLFVVVRDDATRFRPNQEACPEFVTALRRAHTAGVTIVAKRARFGTRTATTTPSDDTNALTIRNPENCYSDIDLPIEWPEEQDDVNGTEGDA
jgi:DNA-binding sugar fermentation-stimulating protein